MTEDEWLVCTDPNKMLNFLRGKISNRKLRLFTCVCCFHRSEIDTDERTLAAFRVAENMVDDDVAEPFTAVYDAAHSACEKAFSAWLEIRRTIPTTPEVKKALRAYKLAEMGEQILGDVWEAAEEAIFLGWQDQDGGKEQNAHFLRHIMGPLPFRPVTIDRSCLTPTVEKLANTIYRERTFHHLPFLADALEDAGCNNQDILDHCRQAGEHARGCWCLDLILGKE
jgi:hypothetical protein